MKINRMRIIISMVLAFTIVPIAAAPAAAWHVNVYECTEPGTSGGIHVPNEPWAQGYTLYIFQDGEQVATGEPGEDVDLPSGSYVGKWTDDGGESFHREKEYFSIEGDCPYPDPEIVRVSVSCVAGGANNVRSKVLVRVRYDTNGPVLQLRTRTTVVLDPNSKLPWNRKTWTVTDDVQGSGSDATSRFVGRGRHHVYGSVTLGNQKVHFDRKVRCAPLLLPDASVIGPCMDPEYGVRYINKRSQAAMNYRTEVDGRVVDRTRVGAHRNVLIGPFYVQPHALIEVFANGKRIERERAAPGGQYGSGGECAPLYP